ncbi:hypothetical protein EAO71_35725 [Streptomyces sp. ms191]|uniref:hypothetical protein n=1 Tax=Streptomyces sp. ms191 TaxID=1827978 RepID=UPI0011CE2A91|nr:hypothetical protein [Streptomyces sp. ms191]TXS13388.1 hypothetical protein EAO71_35725 [Streptomyces sp. ms191]
MTPAEQLLIAAADLNSKAEAASRAGRLVEIPPAVIHSLAYLLETHGRQVARAGGIHAVPSVAAAEYAHDIARTHLGEFK